MNQIDEHNAYIAIYINKYKCIIAMQVMSKVYSVVKESSNQTTAHHCGVEFCRNTAFTAWETSYHNFGCQRLRSTQTQTLDFSSI